MAQSTNCFVTDNRGQPIEFHKESTALVSRNGRENSKSLSCTSEIKRFQSELKGEEKSFTEKLDIVLKIVSLWFKRAGADINIHFMELQINAIRKKRGL